MFVAPALSRLAHVLVAGRKQLLEVAAKRWVLHPEVTRRAPPSLYFSEHLERVTALQEDTTWDREMERLDGGTIVHAPTTASLLRDAVIHNGYLYCSSAKAPLESRKESIGLRLDAEFIPEAALACSFVGNVYFGHSICDDIPLNMEASSLAPAARTRVSLTPHQREYRSLCEVDAREVESAFFSSLLVLEDFGQNDSKRDRYRHIRRCLQAERPRARSLGVFLMRGSSGKRRLLVNEEEICERLTAIGFDCIYPDAMSATEILNAVAHAGIVIGVEGSHLAHAVAAMGDEGVLIVLQPPFRFNNVYKDRAECIGIRYGMLVGHAAPGGFVIDFDDVARMLDRIGASSQTGA